MNKKARNIIIGVIVFVFLILGSLAAFLFFSEDKLISAVNEGDVETAVNYYNEHISQNENKVNKYKDIFTKKLDEILQDFTDTKIEYSIAEAQTRAIKELNILQKADEVYEKINILNNSRIAMSAGDEAYKNGDYKQAIIEYRKVTEKSDLLQTKINDSTEKYKTSFEDSFNAALDSGEYEVAKSLFEESKELLPDDITFHGAQEQKIVNLLQLKIDKNDVENGIELFRVMGDLISDKTTYNQYSEMLTEAKAWADYAAVKAKAKAFMVGKWQRSDGGKLDGMIVECNGVEAMAVGTVTSIPNTEHGFNIGDTKWSSLSVIDENTLSFRDMVKRDSGVVSGYYTAKIKLNRSNNTISIVYDIIDGNSSGQTQLWKKVK